MKTVLLGRSSLVSTRIIYGCMRISGGVWEPAKVTPEIEAAGRTAVHAAFDCGINHFDVADIYGRGMCEKVLGDAIRQAPGMRGRIIVATKVGIRFAGDSAADAPFRYDFSARHILESCDASLRRLGLDCIDLYILHRPDMLMDPQEIAGAFDALRRSGKVREFGVSNHKPSLVTMLQKFLPMPLVCNQVHLSPARLDCMYDGTLDQCIEMGIAPTAWSPIERGLFAQGGQPKSDDARRAGLADLLAVLDEVARARGVTREIVTLAWLMRHPAGVLPIVGSNRVERIREMARADELELTREEWYRIFVAARMKKLP
jgi:predicted oxidoreductase